MKIIKDDFPKLKGPIGFVPTMGFLHDGHLSLIRKAKHCKYVVVSIFVNPAQFGDNEDFKVYPRDIKKDIKFLKNEKVDYLFLPELRTIYPLLTGKHPNFPSFKLLANKLCGITRPSHFNGVCMAVSRLFEIIKPTSAYFGLKDYQQYLLIKTMVRENNLGIDIIGCPLIRDSTGIALSSRNDRLSSEQKLKALKISKSLRYAKRLINNGENDTEIIKLKISEQLTGLDIEYISIVNSQNLENINWINGKKDYNLIAIAIKIGETRLIDNLLI